MEGLDKVYDGAIEMRQTSHLFGPRGGRFSTPQSYSAAFRSATPRPWNRPPSRDDKPQLGPGAYEPYRDSHHLSSSSISWLSRGRTGPVGFPFESGRRSPAFRGSNSRYHSSVAAEKKVGPTIKEDYFILASDARNDSSMRATFVDNLAKRVVRQPAFGEPNGGAGAFVHPSRPRY